MRKTMILLAGLTAGACSSPTELDDRWANPETIQYAAGLNVNLSAMQLTSSGLYWQDLSVGTGPAAANGNTVTLHYTGWLPDATMFETSRDERNEPLTPFPLGVGLVIKGWDEGIVGMRAGGKRRLVIRPELAYGRQGRGSVIPPLATLIFDVELVALKQ
jgi:FKBP-type peptidyl-prolyl cis-trans isomerase FkpA